MKAMKLLLSTATWLTLGLFAITTALIWYYRDIDASLLESKYGKENSQYLTIDGVKFHYVDEGPRTGPVVVMIHAHWASLIMWDSWAEALKDQYRVVRFDMTSHGLTGPDPSGDYTLERGVWLFGQFVEQMALDQFDLIGTSLGGTHALRYAVASPDKVQRLVLLNPGALNEGVRGQDGPPELPWFIDVLSIITPRLFFEFMLSSGYGHPDSVDPAVVTRWHEMQMREGQRVAEIERTRQYVSGDIESVIRSVTVPTLIVWGEENPVVPVGQAQEFIQLLVNAESADLITYPGLGHMTALEDPVATSKDIRAYLDGRYRFAD